MSQQQNDNLLPPGGIWLPVGAAANGHHANGIKKAEGPHKPDFREMGTTGLSNWTVHSVGERLRELQSSPSKYTIYREMRLNSPVIHAVFFACTQSLKHAANAYRVEAGGNTEADKQAAALIESSLDDMSFSWPDTFDFISNGTLEQGFSLMELVYKKRLGEQPPGYVPNPAPSKYNDSRIGWRKWATRPAESLAWGGEWIIDEHGGIQGIRQAPDPNTGRTIPPISMEKLLHFRTTVYPANTPEPPPIHRAAYLPWYYSQNYEEIGGILIERDSGIPVVYLGKDRSLEGPNSDYAYCKDLVTNIRVDDQMGIVMPGPKMGQGAAEGEGFLFEFVSSTNTRSHDIEEKLERLDKRMALVTLAGFILLGTDQVGSYALSRHQGDFFSLACQAWLDSFAGIINRHAIPRLVKMNTWPGPLSGMPRLVFNPVGLPKLADIADFVNKLVDKEVITPDENLQAHLRTLADLPQKK